MNGEIQPIHLLLAVLFAIALLGILVGWFARRIATASEIKELVEKSNKRHAESESTIDQLKTQLIENQSNVQDLDKVVAENKRLMEEVDEYDSEKDEIAQLLERREKRIKALESQVVQAEEQYVKGQRDFAKMRLLKAREVQRLQQQVESFTNPELSVGAEADLPVLLKKAGGTRGGSIAGRNAGSSGNRAVAATSLDTLPDITHANLDSDEDVLEMTSEFDFDPEELLVPPDADNS